MNRAAVPAQVHEGLKWSVTGYPTYDHSAVAPYVCITLLAYTVGVVNTSQRVSANALHRVTLYCDEVSRCRFKVSNSKGVTVVKPVALNSCAQIASRDIV